LPKVKTNIDKLISNGISVRVCAVFTPNNVQEIVDIADWSKEHGALLYAPSVVTALGRAATASDLTLSSESEIIAYMESVEEINNKYPGFILSPYESDKNCGAITSQASIKLNGDIKICNMDSGDGYKINFGNAFSSSIEEIYAENHKFISKFGEIAKPNHATMPCKKCEKRFACSGCILRGLKTSREMQDECEWLNQLDPYVKTWLAKHADVSL
jgi:radical SAM protein with 4Fe4S-binding SPASM domain